MTTLTYGSTHAPTPTPTASGAPESVVGGLAFLPVAGTFVLAVGGALVGSLPAVGAEYAFELPDRRLIPVLPAVSTVLVDAALSGVVGANLFVPGFDSPSLTPFVAIQAPVVGRRRLALWLRANVG